MKSITFLLLLLLPSTLIGSLKQPTNIDPRVFNSVNNFYKKNNSLSSAIAQTMDAYNKATISEQENVLKNLIFIVNVNAHLVDPGNNYFIETLKAVESESQTASNLATQKKSLEATEGNNSAVSRLFYSVYRTITFKPTIDEETIADITNIQDALALIFDIGYNKNLQGKQPTSNTTLLPGIVKQKRKHYKSELLEDILNKLFSLEPTPTGKIRTLLEITQSATFENLPEDVKGTVLYYASQQFRVSEATLEGPIIPQKNDQSSIDSAIEIIEQEQKKGTEITDQQASQIIQDNNQLIQDLNKPTSQDENTAQPVNSLSPQPNQNTMLSSTPTENTPSAESFNNFTDTPKAPDDDSLSDSTINNSEKDPAQEPIGITTD